MKLAVYNPNFSIVTPTGCNAKCQFCFWEKKSRISRGEYIENLKETLAILPPAFDQCSITGGEPTMLGWLPEILSTVKERFKKVVMTSNGFKITSRHLANINHLNISRHHYLDKENRKIFGTWGVPSTEELRDLCGMAGVFGVDVTLNCVLPATFADKQFITNYVEFAKSVGATYVCFRKEHSDLSDIPVEAKLLASPFAEYSCPVCRTKKRIINGLETTWRYSVVEPSVAMRGIYELIMQQDGKVTADWEGNIVLDPSKCEEPVSLHPDMEKACGGGGCGSPPPKPSCGGGGCAAA